MTLIDALRQKALLAMKAKDGLATTILRLAQSEVQASEARAGRTLTDEESFAVLRKLIKSNDETLAMSQGDAEKVATLTRENQLLSEFLPKGLSTEELTALLAPVADAIRAAANDGQATGVAMKHLKAQGTSGASGDLVGVAVRGLRKA